MAAMMKEYGWRVPESQRANLIMVEENMTALENGVQARSWGRGGAIKPPKFVRDREGMCSP